MKDKDKASGLVSDKMWLEYNEREHFSLKARIARGSQKVSDILRTVNRSVQGFLSDPLVVLMLCAGALVGTFVLNVSLHEDGWTLVWRSFAGIDLETP